MPKNNSEKVKIIKTKSKNKKNQYGGKNKPIIKGDYSPHYVIFDKKDVLIRNQKNINNNNNISKSPLSGSEPPFDEKKWNNPEVKDNHNCYAYAVDTINKNFHYKPQPGYAARMSGVPDEQYACMAFLKRLKKDLPSMYLIDFNSPCIKGFYKTFMAIDNKIEDPDYHFWRMDDDGLWSHKPGATKISKVDASGNKIINPLHSNRNFKNYQYNKPCFFFCVNPKLVSIKDSYTK